MNQEIKNPEIERNLVVSTGHITKEDDKLLRNAVEDPSQCLLTLYGHEYGYYIHVGDDEQIVKGTVNQSLKEGYSEDFTNLLLCAFKLKAHFLKLDSDGTIYEDLPIHEW